ncbi:3-oxoacyl-ACP synthase [Streptomyces sp. Ru73]|uniref:ketoacyl-ACP synthase III family protein n=1 Tax=Streptomyces sp. Ru73 TaxID=2080748 RepID=UPI000CDE48AB|nr:ketoacyl-ACP synthase III family protein [Streptomyces sp. Ru73]POX42506.1 3-oxoacyl-ACP synthase [Streptomyces sp. Ru73]
MRFGTDVQIRAVGAWFPPALDTAERAVAEGRLLPEVAERMGITALPVATDVSAPDMAVRAARTALERAGWEGGELDLLVHSWIYHQGHDMWSPPHYIAKLLGAADCLPLALHQGCDGGGLALQDAALRLTADPGTRKALVASSDRFVLPGIDRWNFQPSMPLGDAGTAILLDRSGEPGAAFTLRAVNTYVAPELEVLVRGDRPFADMPMQVELPFSVLDSARAGADLLGSVAYDHLTSLVKATLDDAGIGPDDRRLRYAVLPRIGASGVASLYLPALRDLLDVEYLRFDDLTGHLGCGDWGADLNDLFERRLLAPGEMALLIGAGAGLTWVSAIVQAPEHATEQGR